MAWHDVAAVVDVDEGEAFQVHVDDEPIALYCINGRFYATHDICTHAHAHLTDGYVEGDCVECPLHAGVFHIPTGEARSGPVQKRLKVYPVKIDGERLLVDV